MNPLQAIEDVKASVAQLKLVLGVTLVASVIAAGGVIFLIAKR